MTGQRKKEAMVKLLVEPLPELGEAFSTSDRMKYLALVSATLDYFYPTRIRGSK